MKISLHPQFIKAFKKRISLNPKLVTKVSERLKIFQENPKYPLLKIHKLTGTKVDLFSFSVTGDIRIIYRIKVQNGKDFAELLDIGTHNQVY